MSLAELRQGLGVTQAEMATAAEMTQGQLSRTERRDDHLVSTLRRCVRALGGETRKIQMLAWWCTKCNEAIFEGQPLADREKAFLELKAEVDEVLSPTQVAAVRTKLGLSQRKASEILGGGPRAFQKYESGSAMVSLAMSHLLTLLDNDPRRLKELTKAANANKAVRRKAS